MRKFWAAVAREAQKPDWLADDAVRRKLLSAVKFPDHQVCVESAQNVKYRRR
jgi:hypothetical protein